ncbi:hypothetical protein O0L34_g10173 [Tuta absoluta]|nr:hypothetical protein O0L34_g10173 [Tuta absoluta]
MFFFFFVSCRKQYYDQRGYKLQNNNDKINFSYDSKQWKMAWKYIISYACVAMVILYFNDALRLRTLQDFNQKFRCLVDELGFYFEPVGFPIELIARFCTTQAECKKLYQNLQSLLRHKNTI